MLAAINTGTGEGKSILAADALRRAGSLCSADHCLASG
jgi:hypothetical protein